MTLRTGNADEIKQMFVRMDLETKGLIDKIIGLTYFMRGAIQYEDMMWRTPFERDRIEEFIKKRLEEEAKHPHPQY